MGVIAKTKWRKTGPDPLLTTPKLSGLLMASTIVCKVILVQEGTPLELMAMQHLLNHEQRIRRRKEQADAAKSVTHELPKDLQRVVKVAIKKGTSAWLMSLHVE